MNITIIKNLIMILSLSFLTGCLYGEDAPHKVAISFCQEFKKLNVAEMEKYMTDNAKKRFKRIRKRIKNSDLENLECVIIDNEKIDELTWEYRMKNGGTYSVKLIVDKWKIN